MTEGQILGDVLSRRSHRAIAIILGVKERECDQYLPHDVSLKLRKVVLDQVNDFHAFCTDILKSYEGSSDVVLNEVYLDKLDEMHEAMLKMANSSG